MATFNDAALSKLTAKIDSKLAESKKNHGKKEQGKRKRDQTVDTAQAPPNKRKNTSKSNDKKNNNSPQPKKTSKPSTNSGKADLSVLLDEIKALGGDEEDLKLVEDIDSEDEQLNNEKGKKNADKVLRAELAKFAAGLGFDDVRPEPEAEEANDDMNEADGVDGDEAEDDENDESSEEEADEQPMQGPKRKTVSIRLYMFKDRLTGLTDSHSRYLKPVLTGMLLV